MSERIEDQLKQMLVDRMILKMDPGAIQDDASLMETYGVDSVAVLEIVVGLEERFGVSVADEELDLNNFISIVAIANYVRRLQAKQHPESCDGTTAPP